MSPHMPSATTQPDCFTVIPFDLDDATGRAQLGRLIAKAQVIGIGESAHFVSEFNLLRAEVVAWLVAGHRVTDLALEVGADESAAIDAWINREVDDLLVDLVGPLTHGLYGTFLTELRAPLDADHRLAVVGVDLPNSLTIEPSLTPLAELIASIDPDAVDLVVEQLTDRRPVGVELEVRR